MSVAPEVGETVTLPVGQEGTHLWLVIQREERPDRVVLTVEHLYDAHVRHRVHLLRDEEQVV